MKDLTKKFISKTIIKVIIFAFLMSIILFVARSVSPIVSNNLALGQMQNSDEAFIVMNTYNQSRPIFNTTMVGICGLFAVAIAKDTFKFVKIIKTAEKEKEN